MTVARESTTLSNEIAAKGIVKYSSWAANFLNGTIPPSIRCTRASAGLWTDRNGGFSLVGTDVLRLDFNPDTLAPRGLNVEGARTNRIRFSGELGTPLVGDSTSGTQWAVQGGTAVMQADAKYGSIVQFTESTANSAHGLISPLTGSPTVDELRVTSVSVKAGTASKVAVTLKQSNLTTNDLHLKVDLATGTIMEAVGYTDYGIAPEGNGWYRIWISGIVTPIDNYRAITVQTLNASNQTLAFNGSGRTFFYTYPQCENSYFPSSYIPAGTASTTRAQDFLSVNKISDIGFNPLEGTFVVETEQADVLTRNLMTAFDGTTGNYMQMRVSTAGRLNLWITSGGVTQANVNTVNGSVARTIVKAAFTYKAGECTACLNGGDVVTGSLGTVPNVDRIVFGRSASGVDINFGWYRKITYYPVKLSNNQLQTLTS